METKSCKLTYNIQNHVLIETVLEMTMDTIADAEGTPAKELLGQIQKALKTYMFMFSEFVQNDEDKMILISCTELFCSQSDKFAAQFHNLIQLFYKDDVIAGKNVLDWADKAKESVENYKEPEDDEDDLGSDFDEELDEIGVDNRKKYLQNM